MVKRVRSVEDLDSGHPLLGNARNARSLPRSEVQSAERGAPTRDNAAAPEPSVFNAGRVAAESSGGVQDLATAHALRLDIDATRAEYANTPYRNATGRAALRVKLNALMDAAKRRVRFGVKGSTS